MTTPLTLDHDGRALLDLARTPHVRVDGVTHRGLTGHSVTRTPQPDDGEQVVITGAVGDSGLAATVTVHITPSVTGTVAEVALELHHRADTPVVVTAADALCGRLAEGEWSGRALRSSWGLEFEPVDLDLGSPVEVASRTGRSSHGWHPWCAFEHADGGGVVVAPAWSGNWRVLFEPVRDARTGTLTAGISTWSFSRTIAPGDSFTAPAVAVAVAAGAEEAAAALAGAVRDWTPRTPASDAVPVEWNHWWPYEDAEITADVFRANARVAADLGFEISVLDAGWFGDADPGSEWYELRGDWDRENTARFPTGIRGLAEDVRATGQQFGIWCEAEAVGVAARLRTEHPELMARRDDDLPAEPMDAANPGWLGYVCLGSPQARAHVAAVFEGLVERTDCRWIKLDFNLDPGAGCSRTDHGHQAGDGLYEHYRGLYAVLDAFRERHPEVIVEACSSGGLRIDLGLARHVHGFFLSDPDWPEHHLQAVWGASQMLPPVSILHWNSSEWRGHHRFQTFDATDPAVTEEAFDAVVRGAMMHRFGVSMRLVEMPERLRARLAAHVAVYREVVRPFVVDGLLRPLNAMPRREGLGERAPAFQLTLEGSAGAGDRHVVLAFALPGAEGIGAKSAGAVLPRWLDPDADYRVSAPGEDVAPQVVSGEELLAQGVPLLGRAEATSWLLLLEAAPGSGGGA